MHIESHIRELSTAYLFNYNWATFNLNGCLPHHRGHKRPGGQKLNEKAFNNNISQPMAELPGV